MNEKMDVFRSGKMCFMVSRKRVAALSQVGVKRKLGVPGPWVWIDFETTGFDIQKNDIIEIGAVKRGLDGREEVFQKLIRISYRCPYHISKLTHITNDMLQRCGEPLKESLMALMGFIKGATLIAHNARFDMRFLKKACEKADVPCPDNHVICTYKWISNTPELKPHSLTVLSERYGIQHSDAHRALSDAKATQSLYDMLHDHYLERVMIVRFDWITTDRVYKEPVSVGQRHD